MHSQLLSAIGNLKGNWTNYMSSSIRLSSPILRNFCFFPHVLRVSLSFIFFSVNKKKFFSQHNPSTRVRIVRISTPQDQRIFFAVFLAKVIVFLYFAFAFKWEDCVKFSIKVPHTARINGEARGYLRLISAFFPLGI